MKSTISRLLQTYENGKMSRRDLVQGLAVLAAGAGTASAAGFQGNTINHVHMFVRDLQRSTDYYQRVFGCSVKKRDGNNQLMFGNGFVVLQPDKQPGRVDHFGIGVESFNKASVTADLKARGAAPIDQQGGFGFHVLDPDGYPVQITPVNNGL
jgi:catechol 2,3-dioxygenase-like lactoylglutathione lyase family enzyme